MSYENDIRANGRLSTKQNEMEHYNWMTQQDELRGRAIS